MAGIKNVATGKCMWKEDSCSAFRCASLRSTRGHTQVSGKLHKQSTRTPPTPPHLRLLLHPPTHPPTLHSAPHEHTAPSLHLDTSGPWHVLSSHVMMMTTSDCLFVKGKNSAPHSPHPQRESYHPQPSIELAPRPSHLAEPKREARRNPFM